MTNNQEKLTEYQQNLIKEHLNIIHWTIHNFIKVNESIFGFEYDDLYGEGCLLLCKAAITYEANKGQFAPYATTVIKNGLNSYCRSMCKKQDKQRLLIDGTLINGSRNCIAKTAIKDEIDELIYQMLANDLIAAAKQEYSGIALRGIEALELKMQGYTGREIADMFAVEPNHVGAWISRVMAKLRKDMVI